MNTHEIVNLIVQKFGGNRVKFDLLGDDWADFVVGHNLYRAEWSNALNRLAVRKFFGKDFVQDNYSLWVEGILNGMVRNEAGEMVTR